MFRTAASALFVAFMAVSSLVFYMGALVLWGLTRPFDPRLRWLHQYSSFWAATYLWVNPYWHVQVSGREHIDAASPCVLVSNHASALDILVLFRLFRHFKWVSKQENFRVPFVGWNMYLNRYVRLERGNREDARRALDDCRDHIARGSSVLFFPEGTRSNTGELRAFKPGAFVVAKDMRVPVVPIAVRGTREALPKRSLTMQGRQDMSVEVLPPIPLEVVEALEVGELAAEARRRIARHLSGQEEGPPPYLDSVRSNSRP
jgi:1-acyl-sn-glycerol-3-phosphate acyltransferase